MDYDATMHHETDDRNGVENDPPRTTMDYYETPGVVEKEEIPGVADEAELQDPVGVQDPVGSHAPLASTEPLEEKIAGVMEDTEGDTSTDTPTADTQINESDD
jgi:hypothetical protein